MGNLQSIIEDAQKLRNGSVITVDNVKIKQDKVDQLAGKIAQALGPTLAHLSVAECRLKVPPKDFGALPQLVVLSITNNLIDSLPMSVHALKHLKELNLSSNKFKEFPETLTALPKVETIDLSHNQIGSLQTLTTRHSLKSLKKLNLDDNAFTAFPLQVCGVPTLEELDLSHNRMMLLGDDIATLKNLRVLLLRRNQLSSVDVKLGNLRDLEVLDLSHNLLTQIPDDFTHLSSLRRLVCSHNQLKTMPAEVCHLASLEDLRWANNGLQQLPRQIGNLESLKQLHVQENELSSLPDELGSLSRLRQLFVEFNALSKLPDSLDKLRQLVEVSAHHNQFTEPPPCLARVHSLISVALANNPFKDTALASVARTDSMQLYFATPPGRPQTTAPSEALMQSALRKHVGGGRKQNRLSMKVARGGTLRAADESEVSGEGSEMVSASELSEADRDSAMRDSSSARDSSHGGAASSERKLSNFQLMLESTLSMRDYSEQRQKEILNGDREKKWCFLQQHRAHSLHLLFMKASEDNATAAAGGGRKRSGSFSAKSAKNASGGADATKATRQAPEDFVRLLRTAALPWKERMLVELDEALRKPPVNAFLLRFVSARGIEALVHFFRTHLEGELRSADGGVRRSLYPLVKLYFSILRTLLDQCVCTAIIADHVLDSIALGLRAAHMIDGYGILHTLTRVSHAAVYAVLRTYQRTFRHPFRFYVLVRPFESSDMDAKVHAMEIVNDLLAAVTDLERRFDLRNEMMRAGMSEVMAEQDAMPTCQALQAAIARFEEKADDDFQTMVDSIGQDAVMERLEQFMGEQDDKLDNVVRVAVYQGGKLHGTVTVSYTDDTKCKLIMQHVLQKFPLEDEDDDLGNYGIYVHAEGGGGRHKKAGFWLDDDKGTLGSYDLAGEVRADFKMKPWLLHVKYKDKLSKLRFAPHRTCAQIVADLFEALEIPSKEMPDDYGLYATGQRAGGGGGGSASKSEKGGGGGGGERARWLSDSTTLLECAGSVRRRRIVELRRKPRPVKVRLLDEKESRLLYFEDDLVIGDMIDDLFHSLEQRDALMVGALVGENGDAATASGADKSASEATATADDVERRRTELGSRAEYGLYLETTALDSDDKVASKDGPTGLVSVGAQVGTTRTLAQLEENKTLKHYRARMDDNSYLRLKLHPLEFDVNVPSEGTSARVQVDVVQTAKQVLNRLTRHFELPTQNRYKLFFKRPRKKKLHQLESDQTLRSAKVRPPAQLYVKLADDAEVGDAAEDVNIWREPAGDEYVRYEKQNPDKLLSGTLNKLVEALTSIDSFDREFLDVFLLTYRAFTTTDQVLRKLGERWETPESIDGETQQKIRMRIGIFIKNWLGAEAKRGLSEQMQKKLATFVKERICTENDQAISNLGHSLLRQIETCPLGKTGREPSLVHAAPKPVAIETHISSKDMSFFEIDVRHVAEQLTLYLFQNAYERLEPSEFFNAGWLNKQEMASPNVLKMIDYFNYVSTWVSTLICTEAKLKQRARLVERFVKIADALRELNNYHLVQAFLGGLNNSAVSRLKHTFAKLPKKTTAILRTLEDIMSMEGSYQRYRHALECTNESAIPYIGVALTDLTFVEEGNPNRMDNQIYFAKQKFVYNIIQTILRFQDMPYQGIQPVDSLVNFLHGLPKMEEKELYAHSLKLEPRGCSAKDVK